MDSLQSCRLQFLRELRPLQIEVSDELWPGYEQTRPSYVPFGKCAELHTLTDEEVLISGPAGTGKALALDTLVSTPSGWKTMEKLEIGDKVFHPNGNPINILSISNVMVDHPCYEIKFSDGTSIIADAEHLWSVKTPSERDERIRRRVNGKKTTTGRGIKQSVIRTTEEIAKDINRGERKTYSVEVAFPVCYEEKPILIPAYTLGYLLGDGYLRTGEVSFTTKDKEIALYIKDGLGDDYQIVKTKGIHYRIIANGFRPRRPSRAKKGYVSKQSSGYGFMAQARRPEGGSEYLGVFKTRDLAAIAIEKDGGLQYSKEETEGIGIWNALAQLGLLNKKSSNKFIPDIYKCNSLEIRLELLQGLMDADGYIDPRQGTCEFTSISKKLAEDVFELVSSLGIKATLNKGRATLNGKFISNKYRVCFTTTLPVFRLSRKAKHIKSDLRLTQKRRYIISCELVKSVPVKCIKVDSKDGLFLVTKSFITTHNTRSCLEKIHRLAIEHPGSRHLIVRKTRESLSESALQTFEDWVLGIAHPMILAGAQRANRKSYNYPNGSKIVLGGMNNSKAFMSTEFDMIYVPEAIELTVTDWEDLTTRLRNYVVPFQQIIGDTNPEAPSHWLKLRCDSGTTKILESTHKDNPRLYDHEVGMWTPEGKVYLARLASLTGVRKLRYLLGKWVRAEGVIFENWDPNIHLIDGFEIPDQWRKFRCVDFGYTNPFVCGWWALDEDERMYLYRYMYMTKRTVKVHSQKIKDESVGDKTMDPLIVCDHDAEDQATLRENGFQTVNADKRVSVGLDKVMERLKLQKDERPRLFILRDSLVEEDRVLVESKKPYRIEQEFDGYIWKEKGKKEEPVKEDDHGMDMIRYAVMHLDGKPRGWARGASG